MSYLRQNDLRVVDIEYMAEPLPWEEQVFWGTQVQVVEYAKKAGHSVIYRAAVRDAAGNRRIRFYAGPTRAAVGNGLYPEEM